MFSGHLQVANGTKGTLTPQGAKEHNIRSLKHNGKLISQEKKQNKTKKILIVEDQPINHKPLVGRTSVIQL